MAGWSAVQVAPSSGASFFLLDDASVAQGSTPNLATGIAKISRGGIGCYGLTESGDVVPVSSSVDVAVPGGWTGVQDIAVGSAVIIAVLADGSLDIAIDGPDYDGLASGLPSITDAVAVSCSDKHALALRSNGRVVGWGDDWAGKASPPYLYDAVAISAGGEHSMALRSNGYVACWGDNWANQCDIPAGLANVVGIAAGGDHSLAVTESGDVVAWGYDYFGQAAVPDSVYNATKVFASAQQSYAIVPFGKVVSWGREYSGWTYIPAELQPEPGIVVSRLGFDSGIEGNVSAAGTLSASLPVSADIDLIVTAIGPLDSQLEITADIDVEYRFKGPMAASLPLFASVRGFQDWTTFLPLNELQEIYALTITGALDGVEDLIIGGISSWQATNQADGRSSYLQAVIPAADGIMDELIARENGELVIQKGYRFEDGSERYEEILRSQFDTFRWDRGPARFTVTVSGYLAGKPSETSKRALTGIRSLSMTNGKNRVRCDIDLFLQPGMTVTADDVTFQAGYINYYVNQTDKFCEVGER